MVMEYWTGWFDVWGSRHNIRDSSGKCVLRVLAHHSGSSQ